MSNRFVLGDRGLGAAGDTHPDWMMGHGLAGPYLVVGASSVGQIHLAYRLPRDDAFLVRAVGPWLTVVVADGVGSRPHSRYGATYAVEALSSLLLRPFAALDLRAGTPASRDPALGGLVPPVQLDDVELKPQVVDNGSLAQEMNRASLRATLQAWVKRAAGTPVPVRNPPPERFRQTGSIGWSVDWLAPIDGPGQQPLQHAPPAVISSDPASSSPGPPRSGPGPALAAGGQPEAPPARLAGPPAPFQEPDLLPFVRTAFEKTHLGMREHAAGLGLDLADLSCTALALLLNVETGRGAVGQIGDGALLGLTRQGQVRSLVVAEDTGDPQSTYTLNRPNFTKYLATDVIEPQLANPYVAFYVMTDGLSGDLLYADRGPEEWAQAVDRNLRVSDTAAQAASGLLNWLATYQVTGSWDDRTLVVITNLERERTDGNRQRLAGQP